MDKEEILINLTVLENLNKDQKIISRGQYINIEPVSIIPEFLRRWHRQDNRNECLKKIGLVVNSAIEYISKFNETNKYNSEGTNNLIDVDNNECNNLKNEVITMKTYLKDALKGIQNLKETYATDTQTCARLDVIINKINQIL